MSKRKATIYKGIPRRLQADFSAEMLQARRDWNDVFKVLKEKKTNLTTKNILLGKFVHN